MKIRARKRNPPNRIIGEGRSGKVWAANAQADIELLKETLNVVVARHRNRDRDRHINSPVVRVVGQFRNVAVRRGMGGSFGFRRDSGRSRRYSADELDAMEARIRVLLLIAECSVGGTRPVYRPFRSWWSGVNTEAAFKSIHLAEALIALFYSDAEIRAELPDAARRAMATLPVGDPTRQLAIKALASQDRNRRTCTPEQLCSIIGTGHQAGDRQHTKLRTFRNVLLTGFVVTLLMLGGFLMFSYTYPDYVPLCFTQDPAPLSPKNSIACPTGESTMSQSRASQPWDVPTVAILGLIGGALSAAVFIRGMSTNSTPYNVAVPLALLKVPTGAMASVVGMLLAPVIHRALS